jgi:hypothetical protein
MEQSMSDYDNSDIKAEGMLELPKQDQFREWMNFKGVALENIPNYEVKTTSDSNIVNNIIKNLNKTGKQNPCFGKSSFDKGGGYSKSGFDKLCI